MSTIKFFIFISLFLLNDSLISAESQRRINIEDFSGYSVDLLPTGEGSQWRIFSLTNFSPEYYHVVEENQNRFLRATVSSEMNRKKKAITLIKRLFETDSKGFKKFYFPKDFPFFQWKWRVNKLPNGSDERIENNSQKKSDSAAGVYVYFQKEGQVPQIIKYIWSETLSSGSRFMSPASKDIYQAHLVVLRNGKDHMGEWIEERVNLIDEYKKEFGAEKEPPRILGIGILTDADSTDTEAAADYDDFVLTR